MTVTQYTLQFVGLRDDAKPEEFGSEVTTTDETEAAQLIASGHWQVVRRGPVNEAVTMTKKSESNNVLDQFARQLSETARTLGLPEHEVMALLAAGDARVAALAEAANDSLCEMRLRERQASGLMGLAEQNARVAREYERAATRVAKSTGLPKTVALSELLRRAPDLYEHQGGQK
jgi:hypothetical protein